MRTALLSLLLAALAAALAVAGVDATPGGIATLSPTVVGAPAQQSGQSTTNIIVIACIAAAFGLIALGMVAYVWTTGRKVSSIGGAGGVP